MPNDRAQIYMGPWTVNGGCVRRDATEEVRHRREEEEEEEGKLGRGQARVNQKTALRGSEQLVGLTPHVYIYIYIHNIYLTLFVY